MKIAFTCHLSLVLEWTQVKIFLLFILGDFDIVGKVSIYCQEEGDGELHSCTAAIFWWGYVNGALGERLQNLSHVLMKGWCSISKSGYCTTWRGKVQTEVFHVSVDFALLGKWDCRCEKCYWIGQASNCSALCSCFTLQPLCARNEGI